MHLIGGVQESIVPTLRERYTYEIKNERREKSYEYRNISIYSILSLLLAELKCP